MTGIEGITDRIISLRGRRVILSFDLAALFGVEPRVLTQAVRRNPGRFPPDFAFLLEKQELANLKSQIVISSWGGARHPPLAFTEHGALMAANVLRSPRAIEMSIFVVRAFVRMREALAANRELARRLDEFERKLGTHNRSIAHILDALRQLTAPPTEPSKRRRIGFVQD
jgi:ORF6N domain